MIYVKKIKKNFIICPPFIFAYCLIVVDLQFVENGRRIISSTELFVQLTGYSKWRITQCCAEDTIIPTTGYASLYMQLLQCSENMCTLTTSSASEVLIDTWVGRNDLKLSTLFKVICTSELQSYRFICIHFTPLMELELEQHNLFC